ncbi:non-ribosomal peptide synthetase [Nonomuraea soli]|uniref:Amino acid adenylation domain-containing protein n=1 Tax=Nonomuraea soli TaxID=1032476 RepID=A0A7W0CFT3_9ACTN|nr:non-ribosomal peptide synthetase [Nonomuraea soli]MBA2890343.1 amino acid adenylation domain-containing protein [Nonomuraea soli]
MPDESVRRVSGSTSQAHHTQERPPLTYAQRGLWLLDRLHPDSPQYNVPFAVRLRGPLDVRAMRRALTGLVAAHETLRTVFPTHQGEPYQEVLPELAVGIPLVEGAPELAGEWAAEPFDLERGPLIRARLLRLGPDDHLLVVVLHHIVCDGQSMHLLFDELADRYSGRAIEPVQAVPYTEHATREREMPVDPEEIDWWRDHLAGAPTALGLPADHRRPAVRGTAGGTHAFTLPERLITEMGTLARSARTTSFAVLTAVYAVLLGRLSGQRELLVGTPFSGRLDPDLEPVIGLFVTTLPLRIDLSGDPAFVEVVRRVRGALLEVLGHQDTPFEALVDGLRLPRDPSRTPLIQAMLTFDGRRLADPRFAGLAAEVSMLTTPTAKFDLDFMINKGAGEDFDVAVNYSAELFEPETIERLAARFVRLARAAVQAPETPIRALPVLDDAERAVVTASWSTTAGPYPTARSVAELFAEQALRTPDAPAVEADGVVLTYAELDRRSAGVAAGLEAEGVGPEDVVGICLPRGLGYACAMLGVLRAGAAYLPLDPSHPVARRQALLEAARARTLIAEQVTSESAVWSVPKPVHPAALAYTIFTSGSTGEPKGVGVTHGALANHAQAIRDRFELTAGDRVLQFTNPVFDVAAEELYPTWLAGACVVLCPDPVPAPTDLTSFLTAHRVTVANLPSGYWQEWAATVGHDVPGLRLVVIGSESVDAAAVERWARRVPVPLVNAYGLTETTITALAHQVRSADWNVPVGRPLPGLRALVLDGELEPVAPGVTGELYIGGAGLARGYLGRPDLTADRFVPDPYGEPGERLHRTGDRARWQADGTLELLGRADEQLKVHGHRIEPAEVEAALHSHPAVARAAVAAWEGRLVAYVTPAVPTGLRDYLAQRLPAHLVPTVLTPLAELPTTAGGKLDRRALPAPRLDLDRPVTPPRTELERLLAALWSRALDLDPIGVHDNFFDLGGTSFSLATVHAGLKERLGGAIPLVTLYEHPTISALAAALAAPGHDDGATPAPAPASGEGLRAGRARLRRRRTETR